MNPRSLLAGLGLLALPSLAHAQDCPDLVDTMDVISEALAQVEIERAQQLADAVPFQLECQPRPVNTVMLTGLFQLVGAVSAYAGESADAERAFARAVAISPTTPIDPVYGGDVEELYQQVQKRLLAEPGGSLLLHGSAEAWLDGRKVTMGQPTDVVVGHHLLQWQLEDGELQSRELRVAAMETRQLTLGEVDPDAQRHQRQLVSGGTVTGGSGVMPETKLLIGGGAGVVAGGVLLGLAAGAQARFFREEDPDALEGIQARNHAFAISGLSLMALGAGAAGVSFFVHDGPGVRVGFDF
jgi:hypothetical protein